jgi:hypothetical protein
MIAPSILDRDGLDVLRESKVGMCPKHSNDAAVAAKLDVVRGQHALAIFVCTIQVKAPRRSSTSIPSFNLFNANHTETDNVWLLEEREDFAS